MTVHLGMKEKALESAWHGSSIILNKDFPLNEPNIYFVPADVEHGGFVRQPCLAQGTDVHGASCQLVGARWGELETGEGSGPLHWKPAWSSLLLDAPSSWLNICVV